MQDFIVISMYEIRAIATSFQAKFILRLCQDSNINSKRLFDRRFKLPNPEVWSAVKLSLHGSNMIGMPFESWFAGLSIVTRITFVRISSTKNVQFSHRFADSTLFWLPSYAISLLMWDVRQPFEGASPAMIQAMQNVVLRQRGFIEAVWTAYSLLSSVCNTSTFHQIVLVFIVGKWFIQNGTNFRTCTRPYDNFHTSAILVPFESWFSGLSISTKIASVRKLSIWFVRWQKLINFSSNLPTVNYFDFLSMQYVIARNSIKIS